MTALKSATFTGVDISKTRPGTRGQMLEQLEDVAQDQARAYEGCIGSGVPFGGAASATAHVHDGTNGCVLPIPLCQQVIDAELRPQDDSASDGGWAALQWVPIFVPAGVSKIRLLLYVSGHTASVFSHHFVAWVTNSSLSVSDSGEADEVTIDAAQGIGVLRFDLDVTAGQVNTLLIESWHGAYGPGGGPGSGSDGKDLASYPVRHVIGYSVLPWVSSPAPVEPFGLSRVASGTIAVPSATQHRNLYAYTTMDDHMFGDDMGVSSYILQGTTLNHALIWEKATGQPPSDVQALTHKGHNHDDDTGYATTSAGGAVMDQVLGCWSYGVGLGANGITLDTPDEDDQQWRGRIYALCPFGAGATSDQTITYHRMRVPQAVASVLQSGGQLKAAVLGYAENGKGVTGYFKVRIEDSTGGSAGAEATFNFAPSAARQIVTGGLDLYGTGGSINGLDVIVRIRVSQSATNASTVFGVYGLCIYLEP